MKYEDYDMKTLKLLYLIELQGGKFRLEITIHSYKIRRSCMEDYGYKFTSKYLIIVGGDNLVGLR